MARVYKRDARGRFASGGGGSGGSSRPKAQMQDRSRNRLTRDNSGKITGQGGSGATARGGRLKTAAGNQRGAVLMKAKAQGRLRGGKGTGRAAKVVPARISGRSKADQASRDAWAQRYKRLPKEVRRAIGTAQYGRKGPNEHLPFGRTAIARKTKSTTQAMRSGVIEAGFYLASGRSPFGKKALSKTERADMVASVLKDARSLRARSAVKRYGSRMGGGRSVVAMPDARPRVRGR